MSRDAIRRVFDNAVRYHHADIVLIDYIDADIAAVIRSGFPEFLGLNSLRVSGIKVGDETVKAIASSMCFHSLKYLYLAGTLVSDDGINSLTCSENLANLRTLDLDSTQVSDQAMVFL